MKKTLSIVIMAHPKRKKWAEELSKKLDAEIVYDRKSNIWDTCRRAWISIDKDAEYGLVLQDDAILCDNFKERAEKYLKEDYIYSFFAGKMLASRINKAVREKRNFVIAGMIFNEIALCMKTEHIGSMIKFCDDLKAQNDQQITKWARLKHLDIYYTVPSLIDHRIGESLYRKKFNKPEPGQARPAYLFKK